MKGLRRILVPTDLSDASLSALTLAVELAESCKAKLILLYVEDETVLGAAAFAPTPAAYDEALRHRHRQVMDSAREWMAEHGHVGRARLIVRFGSPVKQILRYVRQHEIDLIVVTSLQRQGWTRQLLGSVAEALLTQAPCKVVVVHRTGS